MKKTSKVVAIVLSGILLATVVVAVWQRKALQTIAQNWRELSQGGGEADDLKGADDILEYIAKRRPDVSMAAWREGDEAGGVFVNADVRRPVASTAKILVLAAYAAEVEAGAMKADELVPIADWEAFLLPGTDGGTHGT